MTAPHLQRGQLAEQMGRRWLEAHGLRTITANFHCPYGELDLIMGDQNTLVFVEIRYRSRMGFGGPLMSVTQSKQQRLARTAQCFLQRNPALACRPVRVDVLAMAGKPELPHIIWCKQAFEPG